MQAPARRSKSDLAKAQMRAGYLFVIPSFVLYGVFVLAPVIVQAVFRIIGEIRRSGTTVLLVEQNARMGLSVADYGYVLETGRLVTSGPPVQLWSNDDIRTAYLGGGINRQ